MSLYNLLLGFTLEQVGMLAAPALASVFTCDAARTGSVSLSVPGL